MVLAELGDRISNAVTKMTKNLAGSAEKDKVLNEMLNEINIALTQADVDQKIITKLEKGIRTRLDFDNIPPGFNKQTLARTVVFQEIQKMLDPGVKPYEPQKGKTNIIMFVGLQGSGKTTTIAKYAHYYKRAGWKCAMVCADTFRFGAFDQFKQNATKIRVPYYGSYTKLDPVKTASDGVEYFKKEKVELILIDTSGRNKQAKHLLNEMKQIYDAVQPDNVIFTMDSSIGQAARIQAAAFKFSVPVSSIIITKMDGSSSGGGALAAVAATKSPIIFIGTGEHFDKFERFRPSTFTKRLLGFPAMETLIERLNQTMQGNKGFNKESIMRFAQGSFTFRDMYNQLETMNSMGSLSEIMKMLPIPKDLQNDQAAMSNEARIKNFTVIMDSMTNQELDNPDILLKPLTEEDIRSASSRKKRIARGSGRTLQELEELFNTFKQMKKFTKPMSKLTQGGDMSKMSSMLQNMGGMGNISSMLQNMGGLGGLGNLAGLTGAGGAGGAGGMPNLGGMNQQQMMNLAQQMGFGKQKKKFIRG